MANVKIKITQPGMENFTGGMGEVIFEDGVSVDEVSRVQAERIRASLKIETLDGIDPGLVARIARAKVDEPQIEFKEPVEEAPKIEYAFTLESLEEIADEDGLAGLRDAANVYGVKGKSIGEIIERMMELKGA